MFFLLLSTRIGLLLISEKKHLISEDKKKQVNLRDKNIFPAMFFSACFFMTPYSKNFQLDQKFFYFVALINFSRNLSNVFLYFVALINFTKNRFNVFFLKCFFYRPPSLDFGFSLI